ELVAPPGGFLVGEVEEVGEVAGDVDLAAGALHLRQPRDGFGEPLAQRPDVHPGPLQERGGAAVLLVEEREQQVLRLDEAVVVGERLALGIGQRLLEAGGELVDSHGLRVLAWSSWTWGIPMPFQGVLSPPVS